MRKITYLPTHIHAWMNECMKKGRSSSKHSKMIHLILLICLALVQILHQLRNFSNLNQQSTRNGANPQSNKKVLVGDGHLGLVCQEHLVLVDGTTWFLFGNVSQFKQPAVVQILRKWPWLSGKFHLKTSCSWPDEALRSLRERYQLKSTKASNYIIVYSGD